MGKRSQRHFGRIRRGQTSKYGQIVGVITSEYPTATSRAQKILRVAFWKRNRFGQFQNFGIVEGSSIADDWRGSEGEAFDSAFKSCLAQINFSYDASEVVDEAWLYFYKDEDKEARKAEFISEFR